MLDAPVRQRHLQLWTLRQTADKLRARSIAEATGGDGAARRPKGGLEMRSSTSFAHEMTIDPLGFALEGFDRFGRWRRADTEGELPSGATFDGAVELGEVLLRDHADDLAREAARRLLSYALCRPLGWQDERTARELAVTLRERGWGALLEAVVASRPFRFQQLEAR